MTAARMLDALAAELHRRDVELLVVRDVGQVRDLLRQETADSALTHAYPTIADAVEAATLRAAEHGKAEIPRPASTARQATPGRTPDVQT